MEETLDIATRRFCVFLKELAKKEKENGKEEMAEKLLSLEEEIDSEVEMQKLAHTFYEIYNKK